MALFHVYDLFTKSRRNQKFLWMIFLFTVPIISFFIYRNTMKRHRFGSLF
ncbi:MAG: PLDc N-terminal domain-containing protein [Chryseotalea sp. WA131a]|nr:MAG: PLDc N-terminal domain-containing protein [Chryseotalea sp. WA131a]